MRRRMNPPRRKTAQKGRDLTPSVQSWKYSTDFKVRFEGMLKTAAQWDDEQRAAVRENIERLQQFLAREKQKLQK